jgi:hypothetical protein
MSNKELWKLFLLFLEMNECKGSYLYYARKGTGISYARRYCSKSSVFGGTFSWSETRQGHAYWSKLNSKWENVLGELRDAGSLD